MTEYRIAKGWAIFIFITAPLMICLFVGILLLPFIPAMDDGSSNEIYWFLGPLSVGMIALMVIGLIDVVKGRFVIDTDRVYTRGVFATRELLLHEIAGFRLDDKYIYIEPSVPGKTRIRISRYYGNTGEIIAWLWERYPDLDELKAAQEKEQILEDQAFGADPFQREESLARARRAATGFNWVAGAVAVWTFFWPEPYEYAVGAAILLPLTGLLLLRVHKGLIKLDGHKGSPYPSILWALFFSMMAVCMRGLLDFNLLDHAKAWTYVGPVAVGYVVLLLLACRGQFNLRKAKDWLLPFGILCLATAWAWGAVVILNCIHDPSKPELFHARVLNKRISSGKTTSYYLELSPWGGQREADEVDVPRVLYEQLDKGATVHIYRKAGRWEIPWFVVVASKN